VRFVAVSRPAAEEIISDRRLQSVEYEVGRTLAQVLKTAPPTARLSPRLALFRHTDGLFLLTPLGSSQDYVVFDSRCGLFDLAHTTEEVLVYLNKILRFATKIWGGLRLSVSERVLTGSSTKAIVFPYPISQHTNFRISIELAPDSERHDRRPREGRSLLVYRSGVDEGDGAQEEVSVTNYRSFLSARRSIPTVATASPSSGAPGITALQVTALDQLPARQMFAYQGYERWLELLTDRQKAFVTSDLRAPHRIEGAAGTGKTLCLILRSIFGLRTAMERTAEHRALFVAHSEATRRTIQQHIESNDPWQFLSGAAELCLQSLKLTTLQQLCGEILQRKINETEFLDRDAMESKQLQVLYVAEALQSALTEEYPTHKKFLSPEFDQFLAGTERWAIAEMMQHEIGVVIKGRAGEQLENYRQLPRLKYGLPAATSADRGFVWIVFRKYQAQLQTAAQFDTDDIVLTTVGQLDTPIWRRRRAKEGYDSIYIDETHLFNINELSMFHHLSRGTDFYPIAYSVDRSQAVGDRGWTSELLEEALSPNEEARKAAERTEVRGIFRCSPHIVNLAFSVTSAGATLFTNFEDPMRMAISMFTPEEERKCLVPSLVSCATDDEMIAHAFARADLMTSEMGVSRCEVVLVAFTDDLLRKAEAYAKEQNKPIELLKQRGDIDVIRRAQRSGRFVLSAPEYVGGLEFAGAVLIGVDDGRVPPSKGIDSIDSANYLAFASHNRLYVAITRARYRVDVLVVSDRGPSSLLRSAVASQFLTDPNKTNA